MKNLRTHHTTKRRSIMSTQKLTKKTLKTFIQTDCSNTSIEAWLVRWICRESGCPASSILWDISQHGCSSGRVSELIYTSDCIRFYNHYEEKIWDMVRDFLDNTGQTIGQFFDSFSSSVDDENVFKVNLVWFSIEQAAHRLMCQFLPY